MKQIKTALMAGTLVAAMAVQPLAAQQIAVPDNPVLVTEIPAPENVDGTAGKHGAATRPAQRNTAHPPGAQALMVLGLALIVTPAMFRGAFSN